MRASFSVTQWSINTEDLHWIFFSYVGMSLIFVFFIFVPFVACISCGYFGLIDKNESCPDLGIVGIFFRWILYCVFCVFFIFLYVYFGHLGVSSMYWTEVVSNRVFSVDENQNELTVLEDENEKKYRLDSVRIDYRFDRAILFFKSKIFVLSRYEIDEGNFSEFVEKIIELSNRIKIV